MIQDIKEFGEPNRWDKDGWMPMASIIVPAYNSEVTIGSCLESVTSQDYPVEQYEVIVVDNGSSDQTTKIAQQFPVTLAYEDGTHTPGAARNKGISVAKGEILVFIDSDCIVEGNWLRNMVKPFSDATVGVAGCSIQAQSPQTCLVEEFLSQVIRTNRDTFRSSEPMGFPTTSVAYRRTAIEEVGSFDAAMRASEDVDLAWRTQAFGGYSGVFLPDVVVLQKHRSTLKGMASQFYRYGYHEILLSTLYCGHSFHARTPSCQLKHMANQFKSIGIYSISLIARFARYGRWRRHRMYLSWPLMWLILDLSNLAGKISGLIRTRFFSQIPKALLEGKIRRQVLAQKSGEEQIRSSEGDHPSKRRQEML